MTFELHREQNVQEKAVKDVLLSCDQESMQAGKREKGKEIEDVLENVRKNLLGEDGLDFITNFVGEDLKITEEEKRFLADNLNILSKKLEASTFGADFSIKKDCSFADIIRHFLIVFSLPAHKYYEIKKNGGNVNEIKSKASYLQMKQKLNELLKYFEYYIVSLNEDREFFKQETTKQHGFFENQMDYFRRKDFSEDKKSHLTVDDYLRLFYLFKKSEIGGVPEVEFKQLIEELKKSKSPIWDKHEIGKHDNFVLDSDGKYKLIRRD